MPACLCGGTCCGDCLFSCLAAVTLSWASDVAAAEGFTFVAIHPGMVSTDMGVKAAR